MHIAGNRNRVAAAWPAAHADDLPFAGADPFKACAGIFKDGAGLVNVAAFQHAGQTGFPFGQGRADEAAMGDGFGGWGFDDDVIHGVALTCGGRIFSGCAEMVDASFHTRLLPGLQDRRMYPGDWEGMRRTHGIKNPRREEAAGKGSMPQGGTWSSGPLKLSMTKHVT